MEHISRIRLIINSFLGDPFGADNIYVILYYIKFVNQDCHRLLDWPVGPLHFLLLFNVMQNTHNLFTSYLFDYFRFVWTLQHLHWRSLLFTSKYLNYKKNHVNLLLSHSNHSILHPSVLNSWYLYLRFPFFFGP